MSAARRPLAEPPHRIDEVRLLCLDFDGVLTDNRVLVDEHGNESVFCHRGDGWGIARVLELGVPVAIVSTEQHPVVAARARKLRIECVHGCDDKVAAIRELAARHDVDLTDVAFVGNDVNDLPALHAVGVPLAVGDARPEVVEVATATTIAFGGHGAVREICDWIVASRSPR